MQHYRAPHSEPDTKSDTGDRDRSMCNTDEAGTNMRRVATRIGHCLLGGMATSAGGALMTAFIWWVGHR
jgi:hypothetical protein